MWIESHQSLRNHPKVKKAARLAGINEFEMIGRLHCLWWWALDYAPDGDLTNYTDDDIEDAVDWAGQRGAFAQALVNCGFNGHGGLIDVTQESRVIHDWHEYGGRLMEKRQANKDRMKQKRATHVQRTDDAQPLHVQGLHNRTEQTEQNNTDVVSPDGESSDESEPKTRKKTERQIAVDELESRFASLSGLQKPSREKAKAGSATRWWNPLGEMWELCGKDTASAWKLIESSYKKLISEKMTVSAPQSLINTANALHAQGNGTKVINVRI